MTKLDHALALAKQGFKVFPIAPGKKAPPLLTDWPNRATSDPELVKGYWVAVPDANIGIHCAGMIVLDVDVAKGGNESLSALEMKYGFPESLTIRTPTGGRHIYYRFHGAVGNSVGVLGAGLDIRSQGGYVVAAGSSVPAGDYRIETQALIEDAPAWLVDRLGVFTKREPTVKVNVEDAPAEVVSRAFKWLETAERSVKGQGGDQAAYRVACGLRDMGVSYNQACELMRSQAWDGGCGWGPKLEDKPIRSAYRYAQNEAGSRAALPADFPVVPPSEQTDSNVQHTQQKSTVRRLLDFASSEHKGPGYLIKGLLQRRSYAELFGAPGEGKTFVALDLAYHVAAGKPWMERKAHAGTVLYLAYEGIGGLVKRAQALRQQYGGSDVPLYVDGAAYSLREPAGRASLGAVLAGLPEKPCLIVIDTFARALMGGDENSAQDVGAFNSAVAALIENTGACVMIVHHSGKNKAAGARGSSALLGAIDTELEVDGGQVTARKQRDIELTEPIGFKLTPLAVGMDEDGDVLTSCVVEASAVIRDGGNGRITGNTKRAFEVLCDMAPNNEPVDEMKWRDACAGFMPARKATFWDIRRALDKKGYINLEPNGNVTRRMQ